LQPVQGNDATAANVSDENGSASEHGQAVADRAASSDPATQAAAPSPHEGLSHEQYKKLKRHKKKIQPAKAHMKEAQFSMSCATCGVDCKSRNKLFAHLKSTGHAAVK